jgi:CHASE3 domain sensor protein
MADPHKRYLKNPKRNEQKAKFSRLEVVVFIVVYAIFIGVMLAIVPKDAKWWLDSTPTWSSDR